VSKWQQFVLVLEYRTDGKVIQDDLYRKATQDDEVRWTGTARISSEKLTEKSSYDPLLAGQWLRS
jgi:hypothetical protein